MSVLWWCKENQWQRWRGKGGGWWLPQGHYDNDLHLSFEDDGILHYHSFLGMWRRFSLLIARASGPRKAMSTENESPQSAVSATHRPSWPRSSHFSWAKSRAVLRPWFASEILQLVLLYFPPELHYLYICKHFKCAFVCFLNRHYGVYFKHWCLLHFFQKHFNLLHVIQSFLYITYILPL